MPKKALTYTVVVAIAAVAGLWWFERGEARDVPTFRTATIERTTLQSSVSSTGTLNAVTTVQVGTQVSGLVSAIYADFNDQVKKGQLLARIDPTLLEQAVRDAEAGLERSKAEQEQAQRTYDRDKGLFDKQVLAESEIQSSQYQLAVANANIKSAEVSVERAQRNLSYTNIVAPIDGVVIERNVDIGQTVAASLSAPQIFLLANDLSQMEILALVDESDIGAIVEGQSVRFTVQPYQGETFLGTVKQVRLQSTTSENVVNYTVVVTLPNTDRKLLPGMTATVAFITGTADSALVVPNGALRYRPSDDLLSASGPPAEGRPADAPDSVSINATRPGSATRAAREPREPRADMSQLYVVDSLGKLRPIPVRAGLSDGQYTVVEGRGLTEGMSIVVGVAAAGAAATTTSNPFQSNTSNTSNTRGGGPRGL